MTGWSPFAPISDPFKSGDGAIRFSMMSGPGICMKTEDLPKGRDKYNAKPLQTKLDLSLLREPLEYCERNHGDDCQVEKPPEITKIRVVDIVDRKVVQCPAKCDYIALSYVWGGVQPVVGSIVDPISIAHEYLRFPAHGIRQCQVLVTVHV